MARLPAFDPLTYLAQQRFGIGAADDRHDVYERWKRGQSLSAGERELVAEFAAYREQLGKMPETKIAHLVRQAREAEADAKERDHPFNRPPATADRTIYEFWSKAAYWSLEEAAALLLGRNPEYVNGKALKNAHDAPRTIRAFCDLLELLKRAQTARQIEFGEGPGAYLVWANRYQIAYPPELEEYVRLHGHPLRDWKRVAEQREQEVASLKATLAELRAAVPKSTQSVATRERSSMLKLIIGMAIGAYRFHPNAPRNPATSDIANDLAKLNIALDSDTILKYLREAAAEHWPGDTSR